MSAQAKPWKIERVVARHNKRKIVVLQEFATYPKAKRAHDAMPDTERLTTYIHFRAASAPGLPRQHQYNWGGSSTRRKGRASA